jgi:hypothetical protein
MYKLQQQKKVIAAILVAVITLSVVTIANNPEFVYKSPSINTEEAQKSFKEQLERERLAYQEYLKSQSIDLEASKLLFKEVVSEEEVRVMVEEELGVDQKVVIPAVPTEKLKVQSVSNGPVIKEYFDSIGRYTNDLIEKAQYSVRNMYMPEIGSNNEALAGQVNSHVESVYGLDIPQDAVVFHKAYINVYESLARQIALARSYQESGNTELRSKDFYKELVITDSQAKLMMQEYDALSKKYANLPSLEQLALSSQKTDSVWVTLGIIHEADAFLGALGTFFVEVLKDAVAAAAGAIINDLLARLIDKIEKSYIISNFLYYSDAVVASKYANDYLDKYINDPLEQDLIKKFIPQMNCGDPNLEEIEDLARQKASEYLGYDPSTLDPNSEEFYEEVARVGHTLSYEDNWVIDAHGAAGKVEGRAKDAATDEVTSEGKKAAVSSTPGKLQVKASVGAIQGTQTAGLIALSITPGVNLRSVTSFVSTLASTIIKSLITNFILSTSYRVLNEQDRTACIKGITGLTPIVPASYPPDPNVGIDPNYVQQCEIDPTLCLSGQLPPQPVSGSGPQLPLNQGPTNLTLDKDTYLVGQVPEYQITGAAPNEIIYFATDTSPRRTPDADLSWISYEVDNEIIMTDENGNWPSTGNKTPWNSGWSCEDPKGTFTRLVKIGGQVHGFVYKLEDNPNNPCTFS